MIDRREKIASDIDAVLAMGASQVSVTLTAKAAQALIRDLRWCSRSIADDEYDAHKVVGNPSR
ncbi:MAG: hypothetical protein AAFR68_04090 [Pseudomonadota bacterium]